MWTVLFNRIRWWFNRNAYPPPTILDLEGRRDELMWMRIDEINQKWQVYLTENFFKEDPLMYHLKEKRRRRQ